MGVIQNLLRKREEEKFRRRSREERMDDIKMEMKLRGEKIHDETFPELKELQSYEKEDYHDYIRTQVLKKRAERLNKLLGVSYYGDKPKQINIPKPKNIKQKPTKILESKYSLGKVNWK